MNTSLRTIWLTILSAAFLYGCSGVGSTIQPPTVPQSNIEVQSNPAEVAAQQNRYLWSYHFIWVDPSTNKFEVIPVRDVQGHWNVLKFLEQGLCTNCVKVLGMTNSDHGTKLVDIQIQHPFPSLNLTGFDVRGVAMFRGSKTFPTIGLNVPDASLGDGELVNADGFTSLYHSGTELQDPAGYQSYTKGKFATLLAPDAKVNGYMRFITSDPSNTRNAFYAGTSIAATYDIDMPDTQFILGYAVDASWVPPTTKPVTDPMTQFPPEANCPEAWKIVITDTPVGNGLTDCGGQTILTIDVYDWQGKDDVYPVVVECPELFDGEVEAVWIADDVSFTTYEAVVENDNNAPAGSYRCLVSKEAQENDPLKPWLDITAYRLHELEVVVGIMMPPTAVAEASQLSAYVGEAISFDATDSHDNDCGNLSIVTYQWDWSNDGTYDQYGALADHSWSAEGTYNVQLKVTDDEGEADTLDVPLEITVLGPIPPEACASYEPQDPAIPCEIIYFDASCSTDDGTIVLYEWDFDGDGAFEFSTEDPIAEHGFGAPGEYSVDLRVTDDNDLTDTLDEPLLVVVENALPTAVAEASKYTAFVDEMINFDGSGSFDNDCEGLEIVLWEWDWDNDGTYDEEGVEADHSWSTVGIYQVQLRVTDDEGQTDTLDEPLEVTIELLLMPHSWTKTWGGLDVDQGYCVAADGSGNTYVTGYFAGTVDFDPGAGVDSHTSTFLWDVFLSKFDPSGTFLWAQTWGGNNWQRGRSVDTDASGNVYVTGTYRAESLTSFDMFAFLRKFDSSGNLLWERTWGGTKKYNEGWSVVVDASGNAYVTGDFEGTVDFYPGSGVDNHTANGSLDAFLSKFDSSGAFLWAKTWGGSVDDHGRSIDLDGSGNAYVAGQFQETVDFDPGGGVDNHISNGSHDAFLSQFDSAGNFLWAKTWGGGNAEDSPGVAVDNSGSVYATGYFELTVDFDPGGGVDNHTSTNYRDSFLSKFDSSGGFLWARTWGGNSTDASYGVDVDGSGSVYVTGAFRETVDFDPGIGVNNHTSNGAPDVFLSNFDSSGGFLWAKTWGGIDWDEGYGVAADGSGNVYVTGYFGGVGGTVDFDPGPGFDNHTSNGASDIFLSKFVP